VIILGKPRDYLASVTEEDVSHLVHEGLRVAGHDAVKEVRWEEPVTGRRRADAIIWTRITATPDLVIEIKKGEKRQTALDQVIGYAETHPSGPIPLIGVVYLLNGVYVGELFRLSDLTPWYIDRWPTPEELGNYARCFRLGKSEPLEMVNGLWESPDFVERALCILCDLAQMRHEVEASSAKALVYSIIRAAQTKQITPTERRQVVADGYYCLADIGVDHWHPALALRAAKFAKHQYTDTYLSATE
jgi:hypothetical protein